jgi:hypothetical protein
MDYNWEEIFKQKETKELYEIYCGNSLLPESTIAYAKEELIKRNFDFTNLDVIRDSFKLEEIEKDLDYLLIDLAKRPQISFQFILISILASLLITIFILRFKNIEINPFYFLIPAFTWILVTVINNYIHKSSLTRIKILENKKSEILKKFDDNGLLNKKINLIEELSNKSETRIKEYYRLNKIIGRVFIIGYTVYIVYCLLFH